MEPVKKSRKGVWVTVALCVICLGIGIAIPVQADKKQSDDMEKLESVYNILKDNWYYADKGNEESLPIEKRLLEQAIQGMSVLEEDPHTNYMDLEQAKAFSSSLAGSSVGIGVSYFINEDGYMQVRDVYVNGAAEKAGIKPGDVIVKVGNTTTQNKETDDIVQTIRNYEGQQMPLEYVRNGETETINITPGHFDTTVICTTEGETGIITLTSFSEESGKEFEEAVSRLRKAGIKNLILDLRGNTGGYLSAAKAIASALLPAGSVIFKEQQKDGKIVETKVDSKVDPVSFDKIVVLQNGNTASASEVLIGALKDNLDNVVTIGTSTYGKGTEQVSVPFADGTSLKYTIAQWLTPNGTSVNGMGFAPDVKVQLPLERQVSWHNMEDGEVIMPDTVSENGTAIQVFLGYLGYPVSRTDNYLSPDAADAIMAFQADEGLDVTGTVDKTTFDRLCERVSKELAWHQKEQDSQLQAALAEVNHGNE